VVELLEKTLLLDPDERWTVEECLDHGYVKLIDFSYISLFHHLLSSF